MTRTSWLLLLAACTPEPLEDAAPNTGIQLDAFQSELPGEVDRRSVRMCVTSDYIHVIWLRHDDVWLTHSTDGGDSFLTAPVRIKQGPGHAASPQIACAADRVWVVWEDDRDGDTGYQNIYLNHSANGGLDWADRDVLVDGDEDGEAISLGPRIALSGGKVHVVWYDQRNGAPDVMMATSINGGRGFEEPVQVNPDPGQYWSGNPQLHAKGDQVMAVWEESRSGQQDLFMAASSDEGRSFRSVARIDTGDDPGTAFSFSPQIASDGDHVYVVWHDGRGGAESDVFLNYSADGGRSWLGEAVRVDDGDGDGFSRSMGPRLLVRGDTAHVAWRDHRDQVGAIYARTVVAGTPVDNDVRVSELAPSHAGSPQIAANDSLLVGAWLTLDEALPTIAYNTAPLDEPGAWDEPQSIADVFGAVADLTVDVRDDRLYAAWTEAGETNGVFFKAKTLP